MIPTPLPEIIPLRSAFEGFGRTSDKKMAMNNGTWVLDACQRTLIYLGDLGKKLYNQ